MSESLDQMRSLTRAYLKSLKQVTERSALEIPIVLAELFDELNSKSLDVDNFYIRQMLEIYAAIKAKRHIEGIQQLDARLKEVGIVGVNKAINVSGDYWICSIETQVWNHALHMKTQNMDYLVLLRFGDDAKVTREDFIKKFPSLEGENLADLQKLADNQFLPQLHIRKCKPKKAQILASSNVGGCDELKYGDCRDKGYIGSLDVFYKSRIDCAIAYYGDINFCLADIASYFEDIDSWIK